MMRSLNVVCAKWGTAYTAEYVNRLHRGVCRHSRRTVNLYCVTDDAVGIDKEITCLKLKEFSFQDALTKAQEKAPKTNGAFKKIAMFEPGLLPDLGQWLAFDLDVVVTNAIDDLADFAPGHVAMAPPFSHSSKRPTFGEGSVIKFEPEYHGFLFSDLANSAAPMVRKYFGSEQSYTSGRADARGVFSPFPREWVVSYKRHCRPKRPLNAFVTPKMPDDAKVVCFHGVPCVAQAIKGFDAGILHRTMPAPWVAQNWK